MPEHGSDGGFERAADHHWQTTRDRCMREAGWILRNPADAEEAVQEALLRAWRHRSRDVIRPSAWLSTIVRREALRIAERRRRQAASERSEEFTDVSVHQPWEAAVLDTVFVEGLLKGFDEGDQRLLRLRYVEDLTQPQIARQLGLAEGTVKVRLHRLRQRLRQQLEASTDA